MDQRTEERMEGRRKDEWKEGQKDRRKDGRKDGRKEEWKEGQKDRRQDGKKDGRMEGNSSSAASLNVFLSLIKILKKESSKYPHSNLELGMKWAGEAQQQEMLCALFSLFFNSTFLLLFFPALINLRIFTVS